MRSAKRAKPPKTDIGDAKALIASGRSLSSREIDFHTSVLESGSPVADAEMAVAISFQAIGVGLLAGMLAVPDAAWLLKIGMGATALFAMILGATLAVRVLAEAYDRKNTLRDLYLHRRNLEAPVTRRWPWC